MNTTEMHQQAKNVAQMIKGVRVDGDMVIVSVRGGNEAARQLCGALIAMKEVAIKMPNNREVAL